MELFDSTGKVTTKSGVLKATKGFESLVLNTNVAFKDLSTEMIKVEIQRAGKNVPVTNGFISIRDFMLMSTAGESAITVDVDNRLSVQCDLTYGGNIPLFEKEEIRVELMGLKTADSWIVDAMETWETAQHVYEFEQRIMASDIKQQTFLFDGDNLALIDNSDDVSEIRITYDNGQVIPYSMRELRAMLRHKDPIVIVEGSGGSVFSNISDKLALPLFNIDQMEVTKAQGDTFNVLVRGEVN